VLADISRMFGESPLDSAGLLTQVCRSVAELVKDAASVRLLDATGTYLYTSAIWHPDPELRALMQAAGPVSIPVDVDPTGPVLVSRQGLLVPHLAWTPELVGALPEALRESANFTQQRPHTLIAAPLRARGRHLGILVATRHDTKEPFTSDDLDLLEDIASSTAHAVASATDLAELDRERAASAVRAAAERRWKIVVDTLPALVAYVDTDMRYQLANEQHRAWFGVPPEQVVGMTVEQLLGPDALAVLRPRLEAAFAGRRVDFTQELTYELVGKRVVDGIYEPDIDAAGVVRGVAVLVRDVTPARRAEERMAILAEASRILTSSRDTRTTLREIAEAIVPRFADWFGVEVPTANGGLEVHTAYNADPEQLRRALLSRQGWSTDPDAPAGSLWVLRTGLPELLQVDETQHATTYDPERLEGIRMMGILSVINVPIPTANGIFGVLKLSTSTESGRRWEQADLALAQELATRIGLALDNARLFAEARAADHAKDQFLAMLAHELRNPLAPILSGIQLLRVRKEPGPMHDKSLEAMERQAKNLARLVDDLLDISRITSGMVELRRVSCELRTLVESAVDTTRPLLDLRNHDVVVDVPEGIAVDADPVRIEQVFANLLNNAAKYTDAGGRITVTARVNHDTVVVDVSDNGIGIAAEVLPHVFQPFRQGAVSIERARGGLGLGLALVHQLVGMHGGSAQAHSAGPGLGSTFSVELPRAVVAAPGRDRRPAAGTGGRRVLVVDDNLDAAEAIRDLLDAVGHQVEVASDGTQALSAMDRFPAEVVLLDLGLPEMDGYEVARTLRARGIRARIVALSGYGREEDRKATRAAGFDAHLVKPVDVHTLLASLEQG
jgi:PAS domain S-box-containing protein